MRRRQAPILVSDKSARRARGDENKMFAACWAHVCSAVHETLIYSVLRAGPAQRRCHQPNIASMLTCRRDPPGLFAPQTSRSPTSPPSSAPLHRICIAATPKSQPPYSSSIRRAQPRAGSACSSVSRSFELCDLQPRQPRARPGTNTTVATSIRPSHLGRKHPLALPKLHRGLAQ